MTAEQLLIERENDIKAFLQAGKKLLDVAGIKMNENGDMPNIDIFGLMTKLPMLMSKSNTEFETLAKMYEKYKHLIPTDGK